MTNFLLANQQVLWISKAGMTGKLLSIITKIRMSTLLGNANQLDTKVRETAINTDQFQVEPRACLKKLSFNYYHSTQNEVTSDQFHFCSVQSFIHYLFSFQYVAPQTNYREMHLLISVKKCMAYIAYLNLKAHPQHILECRF